MNAELTTQHLTKSTYDDLRDLHMQDKFHENGENYRHDKYKQNNDFWTTMNTGWTLDEHWLTDM